MSMTRDYVFLGILFGLILAANLTITAEREAQVAFSDPYLWGIKEVLVSHKDAGDIKSRDDLAGRRIHVRENSSYHGSLLRLDGAKGQPRAQGQPGPVRQVREKGDPDRQHLFQAVL
ncbi:MAG: transporter substrate-binding domain-containing protein [Candidatus Aminicenantaceae bacterium]